MPTIQQWIFGIVAVFFIAALINYKYVLNQLKLFKNIFRKPKILSITFFIDLLFYIAMFFITTVFFILLKSKATELQNLDMASIQQNILEEATQSKMAMAIEAMKTFVSYLAIYLIILLIISLLVYTLFKGLIWAKISENKPNKRFFLKFGLLNLILLTLLIILIIVFGFFTKQNFFTLLPYIMVIFGYFTYISYYLFTKTKKPITSILHAISSGFTRFHLMIVPVTMIAAIYVIIFAITFYIAKLNIAIITAFAYWLLLLFFFTVVRIYLYSVYSDLKLQK